MQSNSITDPYIMNFKNLLAIIFIFLCSTFAWVTLGGALVVRTGDFQPGLARQVVENWGPMLSQAHPEFFYTAPNAAKSKRFLQPEKSAVQVKLGYEPKRKGLTLHRTYRVDFHAEYTLSNPTPISQTIYSTFHLPAPDARYDEFSVKIGDKLTDRVPANGKLQEALFLKPQESTKIIFTYRASGVDAWTYAFKDSERVRGFNLQMATDFSEINFPNGAASPTSRESSDKGWLLTWDYTDVIGARAVGMDMPKVLNPGPVAARMAFFAPISLLFFFSVLVIVSLARSLSLHPMHYFFIAAGCFAFQLLFAYLVDLIPAFWSFAISAVVSLSLVIGYLGRVAGASFARIAALAQFAYMVLFSYSFFFDGLTGITIAIGAVITLALLMFHTAKLNWSELISTSARKRSPVVSSAA